MAAGGDRNVSVAITSPELALVDPSVRVWEPEPPARAGEAERLQLEHDEVREAMRRLSELAEVEPVSRPRRSTKVLSLAFAASAWVTLVVLLADLQPWRV